MRIILAASVILAFAAPAFAQKASAVASDLRKGIACAAPAARTSLEAAVSKSTAIAADIDLALKAISDDPSACAPLREAALAVAVARSNKTAADPGAGTGAPDPSDPVLASSREVVAQALAEAEQRAGNLKFEVGPPPPHLTKGRNSGL